VGHSPFDLLCNRNVWVRDGSLARSGHLSPSRFGRPAVIGRESPSQATAAEYPGDGDALARWNRRNEVATACDPRSRSVVRRSVQLVVSTNLAAMGEAIMRRAISAVIGARDLKALLHLRLFT